MKAQVNTWAFFVFRPSTPCVGAGLPRDAIRQADRNRGASRVAAPPLLPARVYVRLCFEVSKCVVLRNTLRGLSMPVCLSLGTRASRLLPVTENSVIGRGNPECASSYTVNGGCMREAFEPAGIDALPGLPPRVQLPPFRVVTDCGVSSDLRAST